MTLKYHLARNKIQLCVENSHIPSLLPGRDGFMGFKYTATLPAHPGETPVVAEGVWLGDFEDLGGSIMETMAMTTGMPGSIYGSWKSQQALQRVTIEHLDTVPECVHTALRKLCDSPESSTIWTCIHNLHPLDGRMFWDTLRAAMEKHAASQVSNRRNVAMDVQEAALAWHDLDGMGRRERDALQTLAYIAMRNAIQTTKFEEIAWGWLGYMLKEHPDA